MNVRLMFPRNTDEGDYLESLVIYSARRTRSTKSVDDLLLEVSTYSSAKRRAFLANVVHQEWAADILEMAWLTYDLEEIPLWLVVELLRHRLIAREFSLEQLSQRAISGLKLKVEAPNGEMQTLVDHYLKMVDDYAALGQIHPENLREILPQGVLTNFVISGNVRAFQHFFFMRLPVDSGGKGGAHKKFQELADRMLEQAKIVYPNILASILPA